MEDIWPNSSATSALYLICMSAQPLLLPKAAKTKAKFKGRDCYQMPCETGRAFALSGMGRIKHKSETGRPKHTESETEKVDQIHCVEDLSNAWQGDV